MKRVVIIEDEPLAAEHLALLLRQLNPEIAILAKLPTVKDAVKWFKYHEDYDLVLTDIQLADGICFEIFQEVNIPAPIIFTTAYDQYALRAFKVNSIDYLLKPIDKSSLATAFDKLEKLRQSDTPPTEFNPAKLQDLLQSMQAEYKKRFAVKIGDHLKLIQTSAILYFQSQHKTTYLITEKGRKYPVQYTLQEITDLLDPDQFFRINRQMVLSEGSILDVVTISNSRLQVKIPFEKKAVIVSRERCQAFKEWLDR